MTTASDDGTARLWDAETGAALGPPMRHEGSVNHAAFSPDGRRVVTASDDGTARLWDAESMAAVLITDGLGAVGAYKGLDSFTRLGGVSITFSLPGAALGPLMGHKGPVNHAAFSPDGRRVVTASDDRTAQLWDGKSAPAPSMAPPEFDRGSRWLHGAIDALIPREGGVAHWARAGAGLLALAAMTIPGLRLRRRVAHLASGTAGSRA